MSERKIAMKRWLRLTSLFLLTFVAAWLGVAQTAQSRTATHRIKLRQTTEIQGYPCAKGYAFLYADGKLENCAVSKEIAFGEAKLPVGSLVILLPDGRPKYAMMEHNVEVAGVKCSGGNWLLGPSEGAMTSFYPSGKLKLCYLAGDQMVQGVPCRHEESILGVAYGIAVKHPNDPDIEFYESGKLESCTLAKDFGGKRRGEHFQQGQ
jgi:ABC-type nickel/cobalt efflux system permease component RcnA